MATPTPNIQSASLYVGDLDKDVTEAQLYELFSQVGPIASIRVCRDAVTRRSLGYAYVNYSNAADADKALEALNYQPLSGRQMRIMWSHRDPSTRRSGVGNIFIKNLDESIDNKDLHDTFSAFGNILSCKIAAEPDGRSKGYGFVHFETEEAANLAIEKVNGMLLEGKKVFVGKFLKRNERGNDSTPVRFTNVFVKNIDPEVTEAQLSEAFQSVGRITNAVIMRDEAGNSKGFGFVNYDTPEEAHEAVEHLNGKMIGNKPVFVGRAQKKAEREQLLRKQFEEQKIERFQKLQGANLYVKNLDETIDDEKLKADFSQYGTVASVKIMRDEKGISKGFGFVSFANVEEANRALMEANGRMLNGRPIYVAVAQRKDARRAALEQQFALRLAGLPAIPGMLPASAAAMGMGPTGTPLPPGAPPPMFPAGAPIFYAPPGVLPGPGGPQAQRQAGMMYGPMVPRGGWRGATGMPAGMRPGFQPMPGYNASIGPRQRQGRGRPMPPQQQQPGQPQGQGQQGQAQGGQPQAGQGQVMGNGIMQPGMPLPMPVVPVPLGVPPQGVPPPQAPVAMPLPTDPLNPTLLAAAPPAQQKQMLGERLFPLIQRHQPELAGKITGMLLEMDNSELLLLLESPDALLAKVEEALMVLRQHSSAAGGEELPEGQTQVAAA